MGAAKKAKLHVIIIRDIDDEMLGELRNLKKYLGARSWKEMLQKILERFYYEELRDKWL